MKKNIILTASFADVYPLLQEMDVVLKGKRVTFIDTASIVEDYTGYVDEAKEAFIKLGAYVDRLDVASESLETIKQKIGENDIIYISGGNSFYLLHALKKSGADQVVLDHINQGKLYIGESAGSIIAAPAIDYIALMDDPQVVPDFSDYSGLGLIDDYIVPHFMDEPFIEAAQSILDEFRNRLSLRTISNHEALFILKDTLTLKSIS